MPPRPANFKIQFNYFFRKENTARCRCSIHSTTARCPSASPFKLFSFFFLYYKIYRHLLPPRFHPVRSPVGRRAVLRGSWRLRRFAHSPNLLFVFVYFSFLFSSFFFLTDTFWDSCYIVLLSSVIYACYYKFLRQYKPLLWVFLEQHLGVSPFGSLRSLPLEYLWPTSPSLPPPSILRLCIRAAPANSNFATIAILVRVM